MSTYTIWICQCCIGMLANGECCHGEYHEREPLSIYSARELTPGMSRDEHSEDCDPDDDCDCDQINFSTSSCDACGDWHHGTRHAATAWESE